MIAAVRAIVSGLLADRRVRTILGLAAVGLGTSALRTVEQEYARTLTDLDDLIAARADRLAELKVELGRAMNATCEGTEQAYGELPDQPPPFTVDVEVEGERYSCQVGVQGENAPPA
jgi:hypothetical protein